MDERLEAGAPRAMPRYMPVVCAAVAVLAERYPLLEPVLREHIAAAGAELGGLREGLFDILAVVCDSVEAPATPAGTAATCNPDTHTAVFTALHDNKTRLVTVDTKGATVADTTAKGVKGSLVTLPSSRFTMGVDVVAGHGAPGVGVDRIVGPGVGVRPPPLDRRPASRDIVRLPDGAPTSATASPPRPAPTKPSPPGHRPWPSWTA
ncbi:hypothetical protein [Streptomyces mirabilis]|uniref:hypothetical protein n=1 Tax=Streptomyces mirabilis TaxID=68239 RepID=UPI0033B9F19A